VYLNEGNNDKAIADFEAGLRINPNETFIRQYLEQAQKRKKEAKEPPLQLFIVLGVILILLIGIIVIVKNCANTDTREEIVAYKEEKPEKVEKQEKATYKEVTKPKKPERVIVLSLGSFTDPRDHKTYKTTKIGNQTWFAENLNYNAKNSKCYENEPANCEKYGRHYYWITAMKACPKGWHLPTNEEWDKLYRFVDGTNGTDSPYESQEAGNYLKAKFGWNDSDGKSGNGLDSYGFAALPGGSYYPDKFHLEGENSYWWSASESDKAKAYYRFMLHLSGRAGWNNNTKDLALNVRCVKD